MSGIVGGLIAALMWGCSGMLAARTSRLAGPIVVLAIGNVVAVVVFGLAALLIADSPIGAPPGDLALLVGASIGANVGFALMFLAFTRTNVGIVAGVIAADGAFSAVFSIAILGERLRPLTALALAVVAAGVVLAALHLTDNRFVLGAGVLIALFASMAFASSLVASAQVQSVDPLWIITISRFIGIIVVTIPLVLRHGVPRVGMSVLRVAAIVPLLDGLGFIAFLVGARDGVAIPAVLAGLNALVAASLAFFLLHERLTRMQVIGIATVAAGMSLLAVSRVT